MAEKARVEIFSSGCQVSDETIELIHTLVTPPCEIIVFNTNDDQVLHYAKTLGVKKLPAIFIDGKQVPPELVKPTKRKPLTSELSDLFLF